MPTEFDQALTETITNIRRGPPTPERRQPPRQQAQGRPSGQPAQRPQGNPSAPAAQNAAEQSPEPENIRETQGFKDTRRVAVDEFTLGLLPWLEAAVAQFLEGDERAFDDIRREAQRRVEAAEGRLGEDESSSIRTKSAMGSLGLGVAGGRMLAPNRPIAGATALTGAQGFARGATENVEEPTLSAERLTSGLEQGAMEAAGGALAGTALKGIERGAQAASRAAGQRQQSSRRQTNADVRRRGEEVTQRPGGQSVRDALDEQPEGFFAEIARGVGNNQTIEQIARRLRVSQEDVARTLLRNRERFFGGVPGDRRLTNVEVGGENRTLNRRNVDRLTREAREIVDTADRFRKLPARRNRSQQRGQGQTARSERSQARTREDQASATPVERGRQEALEGRRSGSQGSAARLTRQDDNPAPREPRQQSGRQLEGPALDNSVRARLAVQAAGGRPARTKLENLEIARENLSDDNLPAVADALGLDPTRPRLRDRILTALEGLRRPGVSALTGTALGSGAALQEDDS